MLTGQDLGANLSATNDVRRHTVLLMVKAHQERVGVAIRKRRGELGFSPTEFAHAVGCSIKTLERWERGETGGAIANIDRVAEALDTTPDALMGWGGGRQPDPGTPDSLEEAVDRMHLERIEQMLGRQRRAITDLTRLVRDLHEQMDQERTLRAVGRRRGT